MNRLILTKNAAAVLIKEALSRAEKDNDPFILTQFMKTVNMHRLPKLFQIILKLSDCVKVRS